MSINLGRSMLMGALLVSVGAGTASARELVRADVPFAFDVGNLTLPAGEYRVVSDDVDPQVVVIEGVHGTKARAIAFTMPDSKKDPAGDHPAMVFVRDRDHHTYRLSSVWISQDEGQDVRK